MARARNFNYDKVIDAHMALGQLMACAEAYGLTLQEIKAIRQAIVPVLERGSVLRGVKAAQTRARCKEWPRDAQGKYIKRTAEVELPY